MICSTASAAVDLTSLKANIFFLIIRRDKPMQF